MIKFIMHTFCSMDTKRNTGSFETFLKQSGCYKNAWMNNIDISFSQEAYNLNY